MYREPIILQAQAKSILHEITISPDTMFSLDEITKAQNGKMNSLLGFMNIIVKRALEK